MFAPTTYGMTRSDKTGWQETCTSNDVVLRDWIRQGYSLVTVAKRGHSFAIDIDDFAACIAMGFKPEWLGGLYLVDTPSGGIHAHGLHTPETEGFSSKSVINVYRVKGNAKSGLALELKLDHASVAAPTAPRTNQPKKKDGVPSSKLGRGIHPDCWRGLKSTPRTRKPRNTGKSSPGSIPSLNWNASSKMRTAHCTPRAWWTGRST